MTTRSRSRKLQTPARAGLTGVQREQCDGQDRTALAADNRADQPEDQADPNPAVGVGPVRRQTGWPSPSDFWP